MGTPALTARSNTTVLTGGPRAHGYAYRVTSAWRFS